MTILIEREMIKKSLQNLILLPNILTGNSNTYTNMNNYFDFIKRRGFIYQQVTSWKINNLVKATTLIWKQQKEFKRRTCIHWQNANKSNVDCIYEGPEQTSMICYSKTWS